MSDAITGQATKREFPCSNCGASLTYDPGAGTLLCPFCGTENEIPPPAVQSPWEKSVLRELDLAKALAEQVGTPDFAETETVPCPGCGAEVGLDAGTLAERCPFCATPLSRKDLHRHRHPRPQGVLPFSIAEREARERMRAWTGSRWFAPNGLKEYARQDRPLAGVYIPHYTYDAAAEADFSGLRGDAYYVTQMVPVSTKKGTVMQPRQVRKIRWTQVSGRVSHAFDDVLVPASETMGGLAREAEAFPAWDLQGMKPYGAGFLAGFRAEAPRLGLDEGFARAGRAMEEALHHEARARIGGDEQRITRLTARFDRVTFKHVLLPVWLAAYRYRGKPYRVVVNGRTGEVAGERPYSAWKIAFAAILGLILAALLAWLAMQGR